jgi:transcriptional regulator with XRE-family HTH domain
VRVRMSAKLGSACRQARKRAGLRQIDIGGLAGVRHTTISHFEHGQWWAQSTDEIVAAYASALGIAPEDLWRAALEMPGELDHLES